ncbi:MAG: imidazolonepropionase [Candidatus Eremiobacteraeota bacterium]|nr:imidazolonepropionase [Candidatus Eremiobacteraeota bacterium]
MKEVDLIIFTDCLVTCKGDRKPKSAEKMKDVGIIENGAVAVDDGIIVGVGTQNEIKSGFRAKMKPLGQKIDTKAFPILPGLVDSHTHPVFAGDRVREFIMRSGGATYQEIHAAGGGIQFTVNQTREAPTIGLYLKARMTLKRMLEHGSTTVEAKSGYGLNKEEEIRELDIIRDLDEDLPMDIIPTFMGAHSIPTEFKDNRGEFIRSIMEEMMPEVKKRNLAKFVDVFCEQGAFTLDETRKILESAKEMGFKTKLHAEEFSSMGSARMAGEMGATSVDHLLCISDDDIKALADTDTILTVMPGTLFFLDMKKYAPARKMIDMGAKIALATDYNAGSCMSESMQMAMSLGVIAMKMTPEEAINSATYNAAFAVGMSDAVGSIEVGKKADMIVMGINNYREIPYHFGVNLVKMVFKSGKVVVER